MERHKAFDEWSATYEDSFMWRHFFEPMHDVVQAHVSGARGAAILDVACGTGDMLRRFSRDGAARLAGVDWSEGMLATARELSAGYDKISYERASAESLPFDDSEFDVVISCFAFHHFPSHEGAVAEMYRVLRLGGRLFICDLAAASILEFILLFGSRHGDEHYFTEDTLKALCSNVGFREVGSERVKRLPQAMLVFAIKEE